MSRSFEHSLPNDGPVDTNVAFGRGGNRGWTGAGRAALFEVWLIGYRDWSPRDWRELPPVGVLLTRAEEMPMDAAAAVDYVRTFNRAMLRRPKNVWAVPVPVGAVRPGAVRRCQTVQPLRLLMVG